MSNPQQTEETVNHDELQNRPEASADDADQYIFVNPADLGEVAVQDSSGRLFKRPLIDRV
jgi:hypothetical protein